MMDINKYILGQIKNDEKLLKLVEKQEKPTKPTVRHEQKPQPNNTLLNMINSKIANQKSLSNHYKSVATGLPVVQEDDNIRLISSNTPLDSNLESQFNFLMSKYIRDPTTLLNLSNSITPNMLAELVHNFGYYESEIRKYRGQYIDDKVFADKLKNMLLKNVNLKYPATIPLNNAMDISNDAAKTQQEIVLEKNQVVDEPINEVVKDQTTLLQNVASMQGWIGTNKTLCNESFELSEVIIKHFNELFVNNKIDSIKNMIKLLNNTKFLYENAENITTFYFWCKSVHDGTLYDISLKDGSDSLRTTLIAKTIEEFTKIKSKEMFQTFQAYLKQQNLTFGNPNGAGEMPSLKNFLVQRDNNTIIHIYKYIITALKTDYQLLQPVDKQQTDTSINTMPISTLPIIDLDKITLGKLRTKIIEFNPSPKDERIVTYFKSIKKKYNKDSKISTICNNLNLDEIKGLYTALTNNEDQKKSDFTDWINDKDPVIGEQEKDTFHDLNPLLIVNPHEKTVEGHGLKPTEKVIHKKYFIDTHKLHNNVLEIRYNKNRHLTNVKTQVVGNGVKNILQKVVNNASMDQKEYHVLTEPEKHLIRTILNMLDKSHLLSNADQQFNDQFQILIGEYNAGNNSEQLRSQLKQYIIHAMKLNIIPRNTGNSMLLEMMF